MEHRLREILSRPAVIVAVGNALRGDDGFGPAVADALPKDYPVRVIRAGVAPENFLGTIERADPGAVLILDAGHFGGEAGALRLVPASEAQSAAVSTHAVSLALLAEAIQRDRPRAVWLLAVQSQQTSLGAGLSPPVAEAVKRAAEMLRVCLR